MLTDQMFQPEGIRERAGEAIYPSNSTLIESVENLRTREEIKVYNQQNAKRNIQRKKFLEFWKKEIEIILPLAEEIVATNVSIR